MVKEFKPLTGQPDNLTESQISAVRAKLIEAEKSGFTTRTIAQIWEEARRRRKAAHIWTTIETSGQTKTDR